MAYTGARPIPVYEGDKVIAYVSKAATSVGASRAAGGKPVRYSTRYPNGADCWTGCWIVKA